MLEKIRQSNIFIQSAFISLSIVLALYILLLPFLFISLGEYPNGLILGTLISVIFCFVLGINNKKVDKKHTKIIIVMLILRFVVLGIIMTLAGLLYYLANVRAFNLICIAGGYLIPIITVLILASKKGKDNV